MVNEMLKLPEVRDYLFELLNECLARGKNPDLFRKTCFAMIPKPQKNHAFPSSWRYIALMSHTAKLYDRILLGRLLAGFNSKRRENQNGFRSGRGTMEHVIALRTIVEGLEAAGLPCVQLFIDYESAFPSLSWAAIRKALAAYNVPEELQTAILAMYDNHTCVVRTNDGETDPFTPTCSVLQGDTLAPALFTLVADLILRETLDEQNELGIEIQAASGTRTRGQRAWRVTDLDYADDIVILTDSVENAQKLFSALEKKSRQCGLKVNADKTKVIISEPRRRAPPRESAAATDDGGGGEEEAEHDSDAELEPNQQPFGPSDDSGIFTADGTPIKRVAHFTYLGVNSDTDADIESRAGRCWARFGQLSHIWRNKQISTSLKARLLQTLILPILTYGMPSYPLTEKRASRLRGTVTRMLRRIHGASYDEHMSLEQLYGVPTAANSSPAFTLQQVTTQLRKLQLNLTRKILTTNLPLHKAIFLWTCDNRPGSKTTLRKTLLNTLDFASHEGDVRSFKLRLSTMEQSEWNTYVNNLLADFELDIYAKRDDARTKQKISKLIKAKLSTLPEGSLRDELKATRNIERKLKLLNELAPDILRELDLDTKTENDRSEASMTLDQQLALMLHTATDGSVIDKGKETERSGYGIHYVQGEFPDKAVHEPRGTTINQCELDAVIDVLRTHEDRPLLIDLDSRYVQLLAELRRINTAKGLRKLKNRDRIIALYELLHRRAKRQLLTVFRKVKSHTGDVPNEIADILAKAGANNLAANAQPVLDAIVSMKNTAVNHHGSAHVATPMTHQPNSQVPPFGTLQAVAHHNTETDLSHTPMSQTNNSALPPPPRVTFDMPLLRAILDAQATIPLLSVEDLVQLASAESIVLLASNKAPKQG